MQFVCIGILIGLIIFSKPQWCKEKGSKIDVKIQKNLIQGTMQNGGRNRLLQELSNPFWLRNGLFYYLLLPHLLDNLQTLRAKANRFWHGYKSEHLFLQLPQFILSVFSTPLVPGCDFAQHKRHHSDALHSFLQVNKMVFKGLAIRLGERL